MSGELLISPMTADDIDDIVLLERSVFYEPWSRTSFSSSLRKDECYVLFRGSEIQGYVIFSHIFDEGELLRIAVSPISRRKGYASLLMKEMFKAGDKLGLKHWFLEVRADNAGAIKLYERFGFLMMGCRKGYYKTPTGRVDAITMHADRTEQSAG